MCKSANKARLKKEKKKKLRQKQSTDFYSKDQNKQSNRGTF